MVERHWATVSLAGHTSCVRERESLIVQTATPSALEGALEEPPPDTHGKIKGEFAGDGVGRVMAHEDECVGEETLLAEGQTLGVIFASLTVGPRRDGASRSAIHRGVSVEQAVAAGIWDSSMAIQWHADLDPGRTGRKGTEGAVHNTHPGLRGVEASSGAHLEDDPGESVHVEARLHEGQRELLGRESVACLGCQEPRCAAQHTLHSRCCSRQQKRPPTRGVSTTGRTHGKG